MANSTIERQKAMAINKFFPEIQLLPSCRVALQRKSTAVLFPSQILRFPKCSDAKKPDWISNSKQIGQKALLHLKVVYWQNKQICTHLRLVIRYQKEQLVSIEVPCSWHLGCTSLVQCLHWTCCQDNGWSSSEEQGCPVIDLTAALYKCTSIHYTGLNR